MAWFAIEDLAPIVIDNGSGTMKAGFGGEDLPHVICKPVIAKPKYKGIIERGFCRQINDIYNNITTLPSDVINMITKYHLKDLYIGDETDSNNIMLDVKYPIQNGRITSWQNIELLWQHVLHQLHAQPEEHSILLTEPPFNPKKNKEKMAQIMFESFNAPAIYIAVQQILGLYAMGLHTGIVLDIGHSNTWTVPVYEGYIVHYTAPMVSNTICGESLTMYLMKLLQDKGYLVEKETVNDIKETDKMCFVALDFEKELQLTNTNAINERKYVLPDGNNIVLKSERFQCCEALFKPQLIKSESLGVHKMLYDSIQLTDYDVMRDYYTNVVLTGGGTMIDGLRDRLNKELQLLAPASIRVRVVERAERKYATWIGGSILSSLSTFQEAWISNDDYKKYGSSIIHRKSW